MKIGKPNPLASGFEAEAKHEAEIETKFVTEGFIKTPVEPRKPDTKFQEAKTEAEAGRKNITRPNPSKRVFKKVEAEADSKNFECLEADIGLEVSIFARSPASGSRSQAEAGFQINAGLDMHGIHCHE